SNESHGCVESPHSMRSCRAKLDFPGYDEVRSIRARPDDPMIPRDELILGKGDGEPGSSELSRRAYVERERRCGEVVVAAIPAPQEIVILRGVAFGAEHPVVSCLPEIEVRRNREIDLQRVAIGVV